MADQVPYGIMAICLVAIGATWWMDDRGDPGQARAVNTQETVVESTTTTAPPYEGWSNPAQFGKPWDKATTEGLLTFRGNRTRSYYGQGPVPNAPSVGYRFPPEQGMCRESENLGDTKVWCGMGWTGQPTVVERNGMTLAIFGGYDGNLHFMDAKTGKRVIPDFKTDDLIKGTPTIDPDGFPLVYFGSRDNFLRVVSFDGSQAVELWKFGADDVSPTKWNDDWDSSPLIIDDYLFEGGENSQFHIFKLNRKIDETTKAVSVAPELVFNTPGWDDELLAALDDENVSIESSPTIIENTLYFTNSGGLVQGWDLSGLKTGGAPTRTFRFWTGDDSDASVVADDQGFLYVSSEYERKGTTTRSKQVGQLIKLDPKNVANPIVWSVPDNEVSGGGIWATPAVVGNMVYTVTNGGRVLGIARDSGAVLWTKKLTGPLWGSPVVIDNRLLIGDCDGVFHSYDVTNPAVDPPEVWSVELGGCIEATPSVWKGQILIGTRTGFLYSLVESAATTPTSPVTQSG